MNATHHVEVRRLARRATTPEERVIALESLLVREPDNVDALLMLARTQLRREKGDAALAALDRAEAIAGVNATTALLHARAQQRLGRFRDAAEAYAEALALGEESAWGLVQLGRCRIRLGELDAAREAGRRAVERAPDAASGWLLLGDVALKQGEVDLAESHMAAAHQCEPDNRYAYARLMEVRLLRLPPEKRLRELEVVVQSAGGRNPHLLNAMARVRSRLGDEQAAPGIWRQSQAERPNPFARKMEAYALKKAGRLEAAARLMKACLLEDPRDVVLFTNYVRLQRARSAIAELERTLLELLPIAGDRRGAVFGELRKVRRA
jgi:tetratricopeptide (TPR) repeat protein